MQQFTEQFDSSKRPESRIHQDFLRRQQTTNEAILNMKTTLLSLGWLTEQTETVTKHVVKEARAIIELAEGRSVTADVTDLDQARRINEARQAEQQARASEEPITLTGVHDAQAAA